MSKMTIKTYGRKKIENFENKMAFNGKRRSILEKRVFINLC